VDANNTVGTQVTGGKQDELSQQEGSAVPQEAPGRIRPSEVEHPRVADADHLRPATPAIAHDPDPNETSGSQPPPRGGGAAAAGTTGSTRRTPRQGA